MNFEDIKSVLELIAPILTAVSIFFGYMTYRRSVLLKKSEWISGLSEKFYERSDYKHIRRILDWQEQNKEEYKNLVHAASKVVNGDQSITKKEQEAIESLVDYLNFFELIGSLVELGQLKLSEVDKMFNYYICNIKSHAWLMNYINYDGFERTKFLTDKIKKI